MTEVTSLHADNKTTSRGRVLCFTSGKGGSGKTILAASLASILMESGFGVCLVDTDFSTRGLSYFALGSLVRSKDLPIPWECCLADTLQKQRGADSMHPLTLQRGGVTSDWQIILPNSDFTAGGLPPDFMLGGSSYAGNILDLEERYYELLRELLSALRDKYDYVILDTRGGSDFSSKSAAALADEYTIVVEADRISTSQISGLREAVSLFATSKGITPNFRGYIANKALFHSEDDKSFAKSLRERHGGDLLGVIPFDPLAVDAYQNLLPSLVRNPDSHFTYESLNTLSKFANGGKLDTKRTDTRFSLLRSKVKKAWLFRRAVERADHLYPTFIISMFALLLAGLTAFVKGWVKPPSLLVLWNFGFVVAGITVLFAVVMVFLRFMRGFRMGETAQSYAVIPVVFASILPVLALKSYLPVYQQGTLIKARETALLKQAGEADQAVIADLKSKLSETAKLNSELQAELDEKNEQPKGTLVVAHLKKSDVGPAPSISETAVLGSFPAPPLNVPTPIKVRAEDHWKQQIRAELKVDKAQIYTNGITGNCYFQYRHAGDADCETISCGMEQAVKAAADGKDSEAKNILMNVTACYDPSLWKNEYGPHLEEVPDFLRKISTENRSTNDTPRGVKLTR